MPSFNKQMKKYLYIYISGLRITIHQHSEKQREAF